MQNSVSEINRSLNKTFLWLQELTELGEFANNEKAFNAFCSVLQALRESLSNGDAAYFGAQLPVLLRGFYYEKWDPKHSVYKLSTSKEFIAYVASKLNEKSETLSSLRVIKSVFTFLEEKISEGQLDNIQNLLPTQIAEFWSQNNNSIFSNNNIKYSDETPHL